MSPLDEFGIPYPQARYRRLCYMASMAIAARRIQVEDDLVFNDYVTAGEESNP